MVEEDCDGAGDWEGEFWSDIVVRSEMYSWCYNRV